MARKTKEEAQETRENILDAAIHAFYENGVSLTSLDQIARQAGVTRGAVYWHFKNKQDIFDALHERLHQSFIDILAPRLGHVEEDPLAQLHRLHTDLMQEVHQNEIKKRTLSVFLLRCDYSGDMQDFLKKQEQSKLKAFQIFVDFFRKAQDQGLLPAQHAPETVARTCHCFMSGLLYEYLRFTGTIDFAAHVQPAIDFFYGSLTVFKQSIKGEK